jgi:hypothetical protein
MAELTGVNIQVIPRLPVVPAITLGLTPSFPILAGIELKITNEEFVEGNFKMIVKDKTGAPIAGAIVEFFSDVEHAPITTDADGYMETRLPDLKTYTMHISKNGKQIYADVFDMNYEVKGLLNWEISLQKQITEFFTLASDQTLINTNAADGENNILV